MTFPTALVEYRYSLGIERNSSPNDFSLEDCEINSRSGIFKSTSRARSSSLTSFQTTETEIDDQAEMLDDDNLAWGSMSEKHNTQSGFIGGLRKKFNSKARATRT